MSGEFRIRPLRASDPPALAAIERAAFSDPWSEVLFAEEVTAPGRHWVIAEDASGTVLGYAGGWIVDGDAHLMNIAVAEAHRRRGIARLLIEALCAKLRQAGASRLTLEVRADNEGALAFYAEMGLESVGRRPGYYDDGGDAEIMWGPLCTGARRGPEDFLVLAIETSCDETAAAVMRGGRDLLGNVVATQIDFHARFGGVVPEIASRKHTEAIVGVVDEAMERAAEELRARGDAAAPAMGSPLPFSALDAIAVTHGPGLVGALVVGLAYAKGLSLATGRPLVGVNHLEGHIFANVLADARVAPPLVALVVSGGHTSLVHMPEWGVYRTLGETLDDAAGEAFDKVAKVLGLGYPGGPILSRLAADGDPTAIDFPRAMIRSGDFRFSLSGLKTAVINHIRHESDAGREINVPDLAASFQAAVVDVQVAKSVRAVRETGATAFCLAGGVAANPTLREALRSAIEPLGVHVSVPPLHLCTDNAAMIAAAAHHRFLRGERLGLDAEAIPGLRLDTE